MLHFKKHDNIVKFSINKYKFIYMSYLNYYLSLFQIINEMTVEN